MNGGTDQFRAFEYRNVRIQQRQFHIFSDGRPAQQIERLEHEPHLLVAQMGKLDIRHEGGVAIPEKIFPVRRTVQKIQQVQERRLA